MRIAVAGLGLIGGSFAKAIKLKTNHTVVGFDTDESVIRKAVESGALDEAGLAGFATADIVLVALYPGAAVEFMQKNAPAFKRGAIVIDLCGVKRYVVDAAREIFASREITFIGGHPMAGREVSGFDGSVETLFEGASMILTPEENTPPAALLLAEEFFLRLGFGRITRTDAATHDEMIAFTSQLAHIVSSAYAQNPIASQFRGFSAGSFGDMTRVAKLNEDMWTELFLLNADFLSEQIGVITDNLTAFRRLINARDAAGLHAMLRAGRIIKENLN
ncbi:MAG: prephenate dehydrogenase [Oscillospiraceae bacterium]|jgi:prephenate dehydrogenase|nr:prephenate dehydrogenase [Oscillospiraceae bacterium]